MRYALIFAALTVVGFSACGGDSAPAQEDEGVGGVADVAAGIATTPGIGRAFRGCSHSGGEPPDPGQGGSGSSAVL